MNSPRHFPSRTHRDVVFVLLGVALLTGVLLLGTLGVTDTYKHTVSAEADPPHESPLVEQVAFESFSPETQAVFVEAIESDSPVWTDDQRPEFEYSTIDNHRYVVEYQGTTYVLNPREELRSGTMLAFTARVSAGLAGVFLLLAGSFPLLLRRANRQPGARVKRMTQQWLPLWAFLVVPPGVILVVAPPVVAWLAGLGLDSRVAVLGTALATLLAVALVTAFVLQYLTVENTHFAISMIVGPLLWAGCIASFVPRSGGGAQAFLGFTLMAVVFLSVFGYVLGWRLEEGHPGHGR